MDAREASYVAFRGEKQRVAIASAGPDREILVFDEPTSGLDLLHMSEVAKQLETLRRMQKDTIVITHYYELIVSCCTQYSASGTR